MSLELNPIEQKDIRISSSQKRTFLACPRRWELKYNYGLSKKSVSDKRPMLLGSAVHYGIAAALREMYKEGEFLTHRAEKSVDEWHDTELVDNKRAWVDGHFVRDNEYYDMMKSVVIDAKALLRFYLKRMELGTRYDVVGEHQIIEGGDRNKPVVEWAFEIPLPELGTHYGGVQFSGIIDAILVDKMTGELVIFDWKVVGQFPFERAAMLDDQLFIYAALLTRVGINITRVCLFQIRSKLPAYPSISKVTFLPNLGGDNGRGFDTTEDFWREHLPANIVAEQWLPKLKGKFKPLTDWIRPVYMTVTRDSNSLTLANLVATGRMMLDAIERDTFPAVLDKHICKGCEFLSICSATQHGGNPAMIVAQEFDKSDKHEEIEIE